MYLYKKKIVRKRKLGKGKNKLKLKQHKLDKKTNVKADMKLSTS